LKADDSKYFAPSEKPKETPISEIRYKCLSNEARVFVDYNKKNGEMRIATPWYWEHFKSSMFVMIVKPLKRVPKVGTMLNVVMYHGYTPIRVEVEGKPIYQRTDSVPTCLVKADYEEE
jgi:hypothetical protein